MIRKMIDDKEIVSKISVAPPRECLKMFGGPLTIEEFRDKCEKGIVYNHLAAPYIALKTINDTRQSFANYQWIKKDNVTNLEPSVLKTDTKYMNNPIKIKGDAKKTNTLEHIFKMTTV